MESFEVLATKTFTDKDFLQYYQNMWMRNTIARLIDVQTDLTRKETNPDEMVELDGKLMKIGERLEHRKILVQEAMDIFNAAKVLSSLPDEELATRYSPEGLKVAEDMLPVATPTPETPTVVEEVVTETPADTVVADVAPVVEEPAQSTPSPEATV